MLDTSDRRWAEELERKAQAYAQEAFGQDFQLALLHAPSLPFYLIDRYALWRCDLFGRACIFMAPRPQALAEDWSELPRHRDAIRLQLQADVVVLLFESLPPRRRKKLISERIGFMVVGAQLYVPEMMLELREGRTPKAPLVNAPETFAPTTQLIAIAVLLDRPIGGENATNLARQFGVAAMSVVRAFDELQAAGVAETTRVGRERTLKMKAHGRDLWREVEAHLQSPVRKVRRVALPYPERFPGLVAGESALALYTQLAAPRIQTLAVPAANWSQLVREHLTEAEPADGYGDEVETWSYDPAVLAEQRAVDKLSLYLSVRYHKDERVAQAAEDLLEQMPWS
jgi:hypothetical protein